MGRHLIISLCCAALLITAFLIFRYTEQPAVWLMLLLCPLIHLWMMRDARKAGAKKAGRCH